MNERQKLIYENAVRLNKNKAQRKWYYKNSEKRKAWVRKYRERKKMSKSY